MTQENRFDFEKVLMLPDPGVAMHDALEELKKCYEEIDRVRAIAEDLYAYIVSDADISLSVAEKQMDWAPSYQNRFMDDIWE